MEKNNGYYYEQLKGVEFKNPKNEDDAVMLMAYFDTVRDFYVDLMAGSSGREHFKTTCKKACWTFLGLLEEGSKKDKVTM